ncbi:MAG: hypothetical protein DRR04_14800 [Gammaproteobacteria bacterium]|nr:MAG: hypothetical protein DRR04_14800 [Gammaproteobacteria bacterium]
MASLRTHGNNSTTNGVFILQDHSQSKSHVRALSPENAATREEPASGQGSASIKAHSGTRGFAQRALACMADRRASDHSDSRSVSTLPKTSPDRRHAGKSPMR